jgi:glycosyltransferase involved in cell wall biosynthesis
MKILQLIPNISPGGAERIVVDLSNELAKKHDVILSTLYDKHADDLFREQIIDKVQTITLGKRLGFDLQVIFRLYKVIKKIRPDIIHTHLRGLNYLMPLIPFLGKVPIVHTVHNDAYQECQNSKIRRVRKYFFENKKIFPVTISKASAKSFKEAYGEELDILIYNGRETPTKTNKYNHVSKELESYKKNSDSRIFINIGRQEKQKNQLMLVEAFKQLIIKDNANAILIIIGGGRNSKSSLAIQKQLKKVNGNIYLLGEKKNTTDYLLASDFFCLSSLFEGMPITLIEAFATETIPISTSVGGITEMISELDDSLLSEEVDLSSYYEALKRAYFLSEETERNLKAKAKQLFTSKYSIEQCSTQYLNLYLKLI